MATLKVYDGTQWNVVAGQGPPGMGVPPGGAAGTLLAKNTAANGDTTWTTNVVTAPSKLIVNPVGANAAAINVQATAANAPALDVWARYGAAQTHQILRIVDQGGGVPWFIDKTGRPRQFVQFGDAQATTDVYGSIAVNFPEPFLTVPVVVGTEASGANLQCSIFAITTTYVGFNLKYPSGATVPNGYVRVQWFAAELRT